MTRKLDDKELENVTGGANVFAPNGGLPNLNQLIQPGEGGQDPEDPPIGGSPGVHKTGSGNTTIGEGGPGGSDTFGQG